RAPYTVPADNPFRTTAGARPEIWSWGLRNAWRLDFDRATGDLALADVADLHREEVDFVARAQAAGRAANFGWPCFEGQQPYENAPAGCSGSPPAGYVAPIFTYPLDHASGTCAIIGGLVVRDRSLGSLYGRYLYADYCAGELRSLGLALPMAASDRSEQIRLPAPSSFGQDACGRVYVAALNNGTVYRLDGDQPPDCLAAGAPFSASPARRASGALRLTASPSAREAAARRGRIELTVRCEGSLVCQASATGRVTSGALARAARPRRSQRLFSLPPTAATLAPGTSRRLVWRLTARQRRTLRRARRRSGVHARLTVTYQAPSSRTLRLIRSVALD
ncbi:MAG TPA: PQQ-dependent sugar dehydrogenase, partial [Solirubrobacteraceae bacterium]|nr:PQQ-dependent sugar dehydrogenase [Solirubrobacteraceae bacterium]